MGRWTQAQQAAPRTRGEAIEALKQPISRFMTGAWYEKIFDPLMAGQYAGAGLGRKLLGLEKGGAIEGIRQRATWVDIVQEKYPYKATTDWKYNFLQELKRNVPGFLADVILDPLWLFPPAKIAKILGITRVARAAKVTRIGKKITQAVGKVLIPRYGQPRAYAELAKKTARKIYQREETALKIGRPISGLSRAEQLRVGQLMKGGISVSDVEKPLREVAEPAIREFKRLGRRAVQEGLLNEKTFYENWGRYMPRLYRTKEAPGGLMRFFGEKKPVRVILDRFKKRKDIPEDIRAALGEIKEAGYPTAKGLAQLGQAIERSRFFKKVAKTWSKTKAYKDWIKLPGTKALGKLKNKYVPKEIYEDLQQWIRVASKGERGYRKAIGLWKYGKVVANPATHSRNMMSNAILADQGGLSPLRLDIYGQGLLQLKNKGKYYKELKKNSDILHETFARREIMDLLDAYQRAEGINIFQKSRNMVKFLMRKGGDLYQAEEQWSKMSLYILKRRQGMDPIKAAKEAERWLFNYREVPPLIEILRGSRIGGGLGAAVSAAYPFITFSYKATPRLIESAWKQTPKITKWMKAYRAVEKFADPETLENQRELLPDYMRKGMFLRIPFQDKYGRDQYLDLNYILPWGDIGEVRRTVEPDHPMWNLLFTLFLNKDTLGRDIVKPGSTFREAAEATTDYIYKTLMPSPAPAIPGITRGGYTYDKVASAMRGELDYSGKARSIKAALGAAIFGLKLTPVEETELKERKESETQRKIRDIQSRIRNLYRMKWRKIVDKKEFQKRLEAYQQKIKELGGKEYTPSDRWLEAEGPGAKATIPMQMPLAAPRGRWARSQAGY
jgi:hypothetical protein